MCANLKAFAVAVVLVVAARATHRDGVGFPWSSRCVVAAAAGVVWCGSASIDWERVRESAGAAAAMAVTIVRGVGRPGCAKRASSCPVVGFPLYPAGATWCDFCAKGASVRRRSLWMETSYGTTHKSK